MVVYLSPMGRLENFKKSSGNGFGNYLINEKTFMTDMNLPSIKHKNNHTACPKYRLLNFQKLNLINVFFTQNPKLTALS